MRAKRKRPARKTIAGLKGEKTGHNEWKFAYITTKSKMIILLTKKSFGGWDAWFRSSRFGSGKTMKLALEAAKRKMQANGFKEAPKGQVTYEYTIE